MRGSCLAVRCRSVFCPYELPPRSS
ncbi:unnamed protein product, partial [Rotaria sp. Silwood2]